MKKKFVSGLDAEDNLKQYEKPKKTNSMKVERFNSKGQTPEKQEDVALVYSMRIKSSHIQDKSSLI